MSLKRKNILLALVLFATTHRSFDASDVAAENQVYQLGYLLDLTAKGAHISKQSQAGAELAKKELASQGIAVEIRYEDHHNDSAQAVAAAHSLLRSGTLDALLCDFTAPCTAAAPIAQSAKMPFFYQSPARSIVASNSLAFGNSIDYQAGCRDLVAHVRTLSPQRSSGKVGHLKVNLEFGELCLKGSSEIDPAQTVIAFNSGDDVRSIAAKLVSEKVSFIILTGFEGDLLNLVKRLRELNWKGRLGFVSYIWTPAVQAAVKEAHLPVSVFGVGDVSSEFLKKLRDADLYQGENSLESASIGYQNVLSAVHAKIDCSHHEPDCVTKSVEKRRESGLPGFLSWSDRLATYRSVIIDSDY